MAAAKKARFSLTGIATLANDNPALYRIETAKGRINYTGIAKKGAIQRRLADHLGEVPGTTVRIEQFASIKDAAKREASILKRHQPKYNKAAS